MRAESEKRNHIVHFIEPSKKKISLYMTFHTSVIISVQIMLPIFRRKFDIVSQKVKDIIQSLKLLGIIQISF